MLLMRRPTPTVNRVWVMWDNTFECAWKMKGDKRGVCIECSKLSQGWCALSATNFHKGGMH